MTAAPTYISPQTLALYPKVSQVIPEFEWELHAPYVTAINAIMAAHTRNASGAAAPMPWATRAGSTKMPAPTVALTIAAVS